MNKLSMPEREETAEVRRMLEEQGASRDEAQRLAEQHVQAGQSRQSQREFP